MFAHSNQFVTIHSLLGQFYDNDNFDKFLYKSTFIMYLFYHVDHKIKIPFTLHKLLPGNCNNTTNTPIHSIERW